VEEKEVVSTYTQRGRGEDEDSFVKAWSSVSLRIGEDTAIKSVRLFAKTMVRVFEEKNLWAPTEEDTRAYGYECGKWLARNAWKHRLYALDVEVLSGSMVQSVYCPSLWSNHCALKQWHRKISGFGMPFFARIFEQHQCSAKIPSFM
jgi:hypothetical protein